MSEEVPFTKTGELNMNGIFDYENDSGCDACGAVKNARDAKTKKKKLEEAQKAAEGQPTEQVAEENANAESPMGEVAATDATIAESSDQAGETVEKVKKKPGPKPGSKNKAKTE
jgi:hypothetical protein